MICEEKRRLLEIYQRVTTTYAAAVTKLHVNMGTSSKADYDDVYRSTESLHADVTRAQGQLNSHVGEHRC